MSNQLNYTFIFISKKKMSYKPRKTPEKKAEITKEIKPNLIPSNIA